MIRSMKKEDIKEIVADEERIFKESLGEGMLLNDMSNDMAHYFVYELDGKLVSYIGVWADTNMKNAQILNFYVKEEYRHNGYAKEMLEFTLKFLEDELNIKNTTLEVRPSNDSAIGLYKSYGFFYSHKRKYYYSDGEDASVYLRVVE